MRPSATIREPAYAPLVHVVRGGLVESTHYGSVVVLDAEGAIQFAAGDVDAAFYPRSAMKPLQAAGMVRAGLPLDGELLALAAASHSGEEFHLDGVRRILKSAALDESDLRNSIDLPLDPAVREAWIAQGRTASRAAQNCSGKHAAMLLTANRRGWPIAHYPDPEHPVQQAIAETVEELTGESIVRVTVDGCGAPLFSVSLAGITRAIARIAKAPAATAEGTVAAAIREHPEMVAGSGRDVARLIRSIPGLIAKDGAEGVQVAALPDGRAVGVKIADGSARARMPVTTAALAVCGVEPPVLADAEPPSGGPVVGTLEVAGQLALAADSAGRDHTSGYGVYSSR
jgi:L-asparaginase II